MSPKLPRVTATDLLRALQSDGWYVLRQRGSHIVLAHPQKRGPVVVPLHKGRTLRVGTIAAILDTAGLTGDELRRLL